MWKRSGRTQPSSNYRKLCSLGNVYIDRYDRGKADYNACRVHSSSELARPSHCGFITSDNQ